MPGPRPAAYEFDAIEILWLILFVALLFIGTAPLFFPLGRWAVVPMQLLVLAAPPIAFAYTRTGSWRATLPALGIRSAPRGTWLGAALIGASFWLMSVWLIIPLVEQFVDMKQAEEELRKALQLDKTPLALTLLTIAVIPAVCEELLMRGAIARGLRGKLGVAGALAVSSVLFGLMHADMARMLPMVVFGVILGLVTLTSDSCLPAMLVHFLNNAIVLAGDRIPGLAKAVKAHPHLAGAMGTLVCVSGLILVWNARRGRIPQGSGGAVPGR